MLKSNDLQFVAKFAIAGPDGAVPELELPKKEEAEQDFTEARDVDTLRRRIGTVQDGVSVNLSWEGSADLGLSVVDSSGEQVSFFSPEGIGGGTFDMSGFDPKSGSRSITWENAPPTGSYSILVRGFETEGDAGETGFKLVVNNRGDEKEFSGVVQPDGSPVEVGSFEV